MGVGGAWRVRLRPLPSVWRATRTRPVQIMTDSQEYYWDLSVAVVIECVVASGGKWNLGGVVGGTGGMDDCVCVCGEWGGRDAEEERRCLNCSP